MEGIIILIIVFGIPFTSVVWFIFDLILFLRCPKEKTERRKKYRNQTILSAVLAFLLVGSVSLLIYWFSQVVQHM